VTTLQSILGRTAFFLKTISLNSRAGLFQFTKKRAVLKNTQNGSRTLLYDVCRNVRKWIYSNLFNLKAKTNTLLLSETEIERWKLWQN